MASRLSAFVVPSETFTLRFDVTARALDGPPPPARRHRRRAVLGAATSAAVILLAVVASAARASPHPAAPAAPPPAPVAAPAGASPWSADDLYTRAAATCPGLPAQVLAAIHTIETRGAASGGEVSTAGALGPMQFLPSTWARYGTDADGDGRADVNDLVDAVYAAADLLCANGGAEPSHLRDALWNYNHSWEYVGQVLALAAT